MTLHHIIKERFVDLKIEKNQIKQKKHRLRDNSFDCCYGDQIGEQAIMCHGIDLPFKHSSFFFLAPLKMCLLWRNTQQH